MPRPSALRHLLLALACTASTGSAMAGDCVAMRDDGLVLTASTGCLEQMRGDTQARRSMIRVIGSSGTSAAPAQRSERARARPRIRSGPGLSHPLARFSQLNAQSRYLDSLSNHTPTYYGQAGTLP